MSKIKFKSIKNKMLFVSLFISSFVAIALIIMAYFFTSNSLTYVLDKQYEKNIKNYAYMIDTWLTEKTNEVSIYSRMDVFKKQNWNDASQFLKKELKSEKSVYEDFFISDINGKCKSIVSTDHDYKFSHYIIDITNRDYFTKAIKGQNVISNPLISKFDGEKLIVIASPIKDLKGDIVGVLGAAISLKSLSNIMDILNTNAETSNSVLVNGEGLVLTHFEDSAMMESNIRKESKYISKSFASAAEIILSGESGHVSNSNYKNLYYYSKIPCTNNWRIITEVSKNIVFNPVMKVTKELIVVGFGGILAAIIMSVLLADSISKPIIKLKEVFNIASLGDMSIRANINSDDEIGEAAKDFNKMMDKIGKMTYYDHLTCLPNKRFFNEILVSISNNNKATVVLIGIDELKPINDIYGYNSGDELLKQITNELKYIVNNKYTVSRVGEDEFAIILDDVEHKSEVVKFVKNILESLNKLWIIDRKKLYIKTSIGICMDTYKSSGAYDLMKNASIAMHYVKEKGGGTYEFYKEVMNENLSDRMITENSILSGIENNEFYLEFQPIMNIEKQKIIGVEALVRWQSSHKGLIKPDDFIHLAEKNGTIIQLGEWILKSACEQNMKWINCGCTPIIISVNISIVQLRQFGFMESVKRILKETGMDPKYLELEITESVLVCNENIEITLKKFKEMGISIALDDFGTGYSSLSYLNKFNFNTLKIDKSFVSSLGDNMNNKALISSILDIGHNLNMNVTAEGVETEEQLNFLKLKSCDKIQGYLFSPPTNARDIQNMLIGNKN